LKSPILSVLMTSYNRQSFIAEAIESVQQSSFQEWELIIVDDGSTDETVNIAKWYAAADHRISVYINKQNLGDYPNRNRAASYAKGKYLMYVDSDDKILTDGFSDCIAAMEAFPEAGIGMQLHENKTSFPFYLPAEQALRRHFFEKSCLTIGPGGTILRRDFFEQIGKYPELYGPANDMYFNLKAVAAGGVLFLPFNFNFYRIHEGQEINNKYSYLYNNFNYLRDALGQLELPLTSSEKEWLLNKNRRRFLVNLVRYLKITLNADKAMAARRMAEFGFKDFIKALLH
jgi:glycosyltransferase involved in cell wall biosynthesis